MEPVAEGKYEAKVGCMIDDDDGNGDCSDPCVNIDGNGIATCKFGGVLLERGLTGCSVAEVDSGATTTSSIGCVSV
jgi:hypothetical protein